MTHPMSFGPIDIRMLVSRGIEWIEAWQSCEQSFVMTPGMEQDAQASVFQSALGFLEFANLMFLVAGIPAPAERFCDNPKDYAANYLAFLREIEPVLFEERIHGALRNTTDVLTLPDTKAGPVEMFARVLDGLEPDLVERGYTMPTADRAKEPDLYFQQWHHLLLAVQLTMAEELPSTPEAERAGATLH